MALVSTMRVACLGLALAASVEGSFVPFADVEELKPQRLEQFCSKEFLPSEDGRGRIRRCNHHVNKKLDDGGVVQLGWTMNADPESILSLDTEAEHGVRLSQCTPEVLEIELPASHLHHAEVGKIVVGSSFVHGCKHMQGSNFLHRITHVGKRFMQHDRTMHRVQLSAEPLHSIAHAVPYLNFHFSYMPVEATNLVENPEMVTDWGVNRKYLKNKGRRLGFMDTMREQLDAMQQRVQNINTVPGVSEDDGGFQSGGQTTSALDMANSFLNLQPKQISNFGWNWNFYLNTTEADFTKESKGIEGSFHLEQPYIKIHAGIYLNFTSEFTGITAAPTVKWTAGINGHGSVSAKVDASLNSTVDEDLMAAQLFNMDILQHLEHPQWFSEIEFATGALPIKMEPGFQFQGHLYHRGQFDGKLSFGGKTHGTIHPSLSYDSVTGFSASFKQKLMDTQVTPPLWLIFTKKFQIGMFGRPSLLLRGDFAGMEKATLKVEGWPYMNVTIFRNETAEAPEQMMLPQPTGKLVTVYPYRISGIEEVDFQTKYKVVVEAFNLTRATTPEMNWGHVEFHDRPDRFGFDRHEEPHLLDQTYKITLVKVNSASGTPVEETMGTGSVECQSVLNGECHPTPTVATIKTDAGATVASVDLVIIWEDDPAPWFASKVRGVSMDVAGVTLNQANLEQSFPHISASEQSATPSSFSLRLVYGGKMFVLPLTGVDQSAATLQGQNVIDFGPTVLDNWLPCEAPCKTPRLDLYYGTTKVGQRDLPHFDFSSQTAMQGTGSFLAQHHGHAMEVPASIPLYVPDGSTTNTIAQVDLKMTVDLPLGSSLFLMPHFATTAVQGSTQTVAWMVSDVDEQQEYDFKLETYKLVTVADAEMPNYMSNDQINGKVLELVTSEDFKQQCEVRATARMTVAEAPCSFEDDVELAAANFAVGDVIVIKISWTADGKTHSLYSPALDIIAGLAPPAAERRLSQDADIWTAYDFQSRMLTESSGDGCKSQPLGFSLGFGARVRGVVEEFSLPEGYPMIGGMDSPSMETEWKTVGDEALSGNEYEEAQEEGSVMSMLCQTGLCSGRLPSCANAVNNATVTFPRLVFDFNRFFAVGDISHSENASDTITGALDHSDTFSHEMRIAMAYAFSTLPELIDIAVKESRRHSKETASSTSPPTLTNNPVWNNAAQSVQPQVTAYGANGSVVHSVDNTHEMNEWWGGPSGLDGRRLTSLDELPEGVGSKEELPRELRDNQVEVHFRGGLPFIVDRKVLTMMQKTGQLKMHMAGVDDGLVKTHGPLEITNFYVDSGIPDRRKRGKREKYNAGPQQGQARAMATAQYVGVLACCVMLVGVVLAKRAGPSGARYMATHEVSEDADNGGLE